MLHYLIRDLNKNEKPREKAIKFGIETLTDAELLAVILSSGGKNISAIELGNQMLNEFGGLKGVTKQDIKSLIQIKYINEAKACAIKSAYEISRRINTTDKELTLIKNPKNAYEYIRNEIIDKEKEYLYIITLTTRNNIIARDCLSIGTLNETLLSIREIFKVVFTRNAAGFILIHNHPSQDPSPSSEDVEATKKLYEIAINLEIPLIDHIVVTNKTYFSLRANNLLTKKGGENNDKYQ